MRDDLKPIGALFFEEYLKELRNKYEHHVYEIDRYVEVFRINDHLWALYAPCTHKVGDNWIYLLAGEERAIFIDNGYGIGDLKGLGEYLTGKEVITAVTHEHGDHCGGNPQWETVYCHKYCADNLNRLQKDYDTWWKSFNHVGMEDCRKYWEDEDVIPYTPYKPVPLEDHDKIRLGENHELEVLHVGGHAPGLCMFLDTKYGYLLSGDAAFESRIKGLGVGLHKARGNQLHPEYMGFNYYRKKIRELTERTGEMTTLWPGHGYIGGDAKTAVEDLSWACEEVAKDPDSWTAYADRHIGRVYIKEGRIADIMYDPEFIREELKKEG